MKFKILDKFAEKVKNDENLQKTVMDLSQKEDKKELFKLMKNHGVTQEEIDAAQAQVNAVSTGELSDEALDSVSGGAFCVIHTSSFENGDICYVAHSGKNSGCFGFHNYCSPNFTMI